MQSRGKKAEGNPFGLKEEYLALMLIAPLVLACTMTDPLLVSVEKFNSGAPSVLLTYPTGGENASFEMNITRFVPPGNWSKDGIFRNFTITLCPESGTPSDITIYDPESGSAQLLHAGPLAGCEDVQVDTSGLDSYFATESAVVFSGQSTGSPPRAIITLSIVVGM